MARVCSVNVGQPVDVTWAGRVGRSSIDKRPVAGDVEVHPRGLQGDSVSDTRHHGGRDQAIYAYTLEDLGFWGAELGREVPPGQFGENLTVDGIDLSRAVIGTRLRIGTTTLQICSTRTPCNTFKGWQAVSGYDSTRWVRRFAEALRPGAYLRVLEPGHLRAGDPVETLAVPDHGITVVDLFVAMNLDHARLPQLRVIDDLAEEPSHKLLAHLARVQPGSELLPTSTAAPSVL